MEISTTAFEDQITILSEDNHMTFDLSQIDLTSLEVVNNTFPEHEFRVGYTRVTDDAIYFSIE